jgi:hypothetical protein
MILNRAWVITREGTRHDTEVIGVLSARKTAKEIKGYIEWLYALLSYHPEDHLQFARYTKPVIPCEAERFTTNTGVPMDSGMRCGDNPYLVACYAKDLVLVEEDGDSHRLKWTMPDRLVCDPQSLLVVEKIAGVKCEAPIRLPLRLME